MTTATNGHERLRWMIYGAYGYTGLLVIEEALARGHRPVLAGRDLARLRPLAERYGLPFVAVSLDDAAGLDRALGDVDLVYHVAGPFTATAAPMREACLRTKTHYVDVTGETPITAQTLAMHERAVRAGILMLPSSGVNTVPSDAVSAFVCAALPDAQTLEVAIDTVRRQSSGSLVSILEVATLGGQVRRGGRVIDEALGTRTRTVPFPSGSRTCVALPLADIHTAFHATHVPNITAYVAQIELAIRGMPWTAPVMKRVFANESIKRWTQSKLAHHVKGPDEARRASERTEAWATATNGRGESVTATLETLEGYTFTAAVAPLLVEAVASSEAVGATTVAALFGPDFVLGVRNTTRTCSR